MAVAPIRIGAGIQNKILETMAMGIPTVTSSFGAEGISQNNEILSIAKNDNEFSKKIIELLQNQDKRELLSINARKYCENNFSWYTNTKILEEVLLS